MTDQTFDVILSDPPWPYQQSKAKGSLRRLDQTWRYLPSDWQSLMDMKFPTHDGSSVYCWCTAPLLRTQLEFIRTKCEHVRISMVWVKRTVRSHQYKMNPGSYSMSNIEILMIGSVNASIPELIPPPIVVHSRILEHSRKPQIFRDLVVEQTPHKSRIEMFSRTTDPNFVSHGDQVGLLDGTSSQKEAEATICKAASIPEKRPKTSKWRRKRMREHEFPENALRPTGEYRVIVLDVDVARLGSIDLRQCQDEHCLLLIKLDPMHPIDSLKGFEYSEFVYKTILFSFVIEDDPECVECWAIGTSKTTRITSKDPLVKRKHISQIRLVEQRSEVKDSLKEGLEIVFGTDVPKLWVGGDEMNGWDVIA